MGLPQRNQQTGFIGYPMNQIYNRPDQQYMLDTQRQFLDWGNWQPGRTRTNQFMPDPGPDDYGGQAQQTPKICSMNITSASAHLPSSLHGRATGSRWVPELRRPLCRLMPASHARRPPQAECGSKQYWNWNAGKQRPLESAQQHGHLIGLWDTGLAARGAWCAQSDSRRRSGPD